MAHPPCIVICYVLLRQCIPRSVDQDHPEDEADQARRHAEPPIEFRQIDRRERKRRRQDQRDQHHSDDSAEPEQQQIAERGDRFADDGQDHQGDGGRSCKAVHEADREGSQPLIERDPAEPTAVEPRQRRVLLGVPVRTGAMTVRVLVHVVAVRMRVIVEVERMSTRDARMGVGGADRAAHPCQGENTEQDQHDADGEFHRQTELWRDDDPEHDDRRADRHDRDGVPDAPGGADQRRAHHAALATDDRRNGAFRPNANSHMRLRPRLSVPLRWGRYYVAASKPPLFEPPFSSSERIAASSNNDMLSWHVSPLSC